MKRKKTKRTRPVTLTVDHSAAWSLVKVRADGSEVSLESGLTWDRAFSLANDQLAACGPGETVSLREAPIFEF